MFFLIHGIFVCRKCDQKKTQTNPTHPTPQRTKNNQTKNLKALYEIQSSNKTKEHIKFSQNSHIYTKKKPTLHLVFITSNFWRKRNKKVEQEFMLKDSTSEKKMFVKHFSQPTSK